MPMRRSLATRSGVAFAAVLLLGSLSAQACPRCGGIFGMPQTLEMNRLNNRYKYNPDLMDGLSTGVTVKGISVDEGAKKPPSPAPAKKKPVATGAKKPAAPKKS